MRVRLRPLRIEDKPVLYDWITDRDLMIFNAPYYPISELDHEAWFESILKKRSDMVIFAIETISDAVTIGTCQLNSISALHRSADFQIRIGKKIHQNLGYGVEATKLMLKFAFDDLNLHRVQLQVFSSNERASRAYLKCGFEQEGLLRQAAFVDGAWRDIIIMGRLASDNA